MTLITVSEDQQTSEFMMLVSHQVTTITVKAAEKFGFPIILETLLPGKMLRTAFANRLLEADIRETGLDHLVAACVATELVHTASLCHDDVIDNGLIRRGIDSLWRTTNPSCAVLIGDILLTESIRVLLNSCDNLIVRNFISKVEEVCITEAQHEFLWRDRKIDETTCLKIARGKTGPLFGFIGYVFGGENPHLSSLVEEAGYLIGIAYQLFDDYIDITGDETIYGKTLQSDMKRGKYTFPRLNNSADVFNKIHDTIESAMNCVKEWPRVKRGIESFLDNEMEPFFNKIHVENAK